MARKSKGGDEEYVGGEGGGAGRGEGTEGLPGGRIPNPPPRDAWVSRVIDDPANPPDAVLLSGYVGDAAEAGRSRIYTDPSLSSYVEVSDEDVLHHESVGGDQVPEGGSLVWVRSDALVTPGSTGGTGTGTGGAAGGDFFTGPVLEQNRRAGTGTDAARQVGPVQITLLTIAGCYTRRLGCTVFGCPTQNLLCKSVHPVICSYVCQEGGGIGLPGGGVNEGTIVDTLARPTLMCPSRPNCTIITDPGGQVVFPQANRAMMAGGPVGPTGWQGCGQPTHMIGCTGWQGCGQETHLIGCTGWRGCGPHISLPGCIHTGTCSAVDACPTRLCTPREGTDTVQGAALTILPTGWQGCPSALDLCPTRICGGGEGTDTVQAFAAPGAGAAAPTTQYAPQCPTFGFTCTYVHCPPQTLATVCTQVGCHTSPHQCITQLHCPNTIATICTQIGCPSFGFTCTAFCQAQGGGGAEAAGAEAVAGPDSTSATVCTQLCHTGPIPCPPTREANCSMATVCTQIGCHTAPQHCIPTLDGCHETLATICTQIGCPSFGFTCTAFCQAQGGGAQGVGGTAATLCTQIGCPTQIPKCPLTMQCIPPSLTPDCAQRQRQGTGGGGADDAAAGQQTLATVCTQFGCIPRTRLCPPTFQPGCGPDHEHGGSTAVTLCTVAPFCPPTAHCPPTMHCTFATVCTQVGCPPQHTALGCPRTSTCPPTYTPGCGGLAAAAPGAEGVAAAPTTVYGPQCPTFGFTCTYVHCPPVTAGLGCPGTSTCPPHTVGLGCPNTITCPPHTLGFGCPNTSTCPPQTLALGCPNTSTCPISADCPPPTGVCPPA